MSVEAESARGDARPLAASSDGRARVAGLVRDTKAAPSGEGAFHVMVSGQIEGAEVRATVVHAGGLRAVALRRT
jgi:hypothetical protein